MSALGSDLNSSDPDIFKSAEMVCCRLGFLIELRGLACLRGVVGGVEGVGDGRRSRVLGACGNFPPASFGFPGAVFPLYPVPTAATSRV
jgi:hypothetical protein